MSALMSLTKMSKPYLIEVAGDYMELANNIGAIITSTGYRHEYIAKKLNMPISTYYAKRRTKTFKPAEVLKIVKMLEDDETQNAGELELIQSRQNDEVMTSGEFIKQVQAMMKK